PQSAWVNRGIGGDLNGAGFGGALGYFRPPGTFSFIAGYAAFQVLVACFLTFYLLKNGLLNRKYQIAPWHLWVMLICFLISIPYSISRTHFFQSIVILLFAIIAILFLRKSLKYLLWGIIIFAITVSLISYLDLID